MNGLNKKLFLFLVAGVFLFLLTNVSAECGDDVCDPDESQDTCPIDCETQEPQEYCGDGICNQSIGEYQDNCSQDCGEPSVCGNQECEEGEEQGCPGDCYTCGDTICGTYETDCDVDCDPNHGYCGDGTCQEHESQDTCHSDCGGGCGNGICDQGEEQNCPGDCNECGDGVCSGSETPENCHDDCSTAPQTCGNNYCDTEETLENCPSDCSNINKCGNGYCDDGEKESCPKDCGQCGNNYCDVGEEDFCPGDCFKCGDGECNGNENNSNCHDDCPPSTCGNGTCDQGEWEKNCPQDCSITAICGDGHCDWHLGENQQTCSKDCGYNTPKCGNNICEQGESPDNCKDCVKGFCGDGYCGFEEHPENCKEDCGIIVKPPIEQCPPKEAIEEMKKKCEEYNMEFSLRQGYNGCLFGECNSGDYKPPQIGDCKEIIEPNGFVRRECEHKCFPEPPEIKERCLEQRGTPKESTGFDGCQITVCEFGDSGRGFIGECPDKREMEDKLNKCKEQGLRPIIEKSFNGCEYVNCAGDYKRDECPFFDFEEIERIRKGCNEKGGRLIKDFDDKGCATPVCISEFEEDEYCKDVPKEAFERCEKEGGELIVKRDGDCVTFATCNIRGERNFEYKEINEIPDATQLLSLAIKLEDLKMNLDKVENKLNSLAEYYEKQGDSENTQRLEKAVSMLKLIKEEIGIITDKIRDNAKTMSENDIIEIKKDIRSAIARIDDVVYVLLGGTETKPDDTQGDCGTDEGCFKKNYSICSPATFTHIDSYSEESQKFYAEIKGIENGKCIMTISSESEGKNLSMTCKDPYYSDGDMDSDKMEKFCEGSLTEIIKGQPRPTVESDYTYKDDYEKYKDDFGRDVEGCKETFDAAGNKYITCPVKEEKDVEPYNPITGNMVMGIKWRG
ncbi:hypothetical protein KKG83_03565 [Candidatus Micrarchaeota archaeon]|nr:hypothetical protein [Candidatus Micrarchaeota archaeon]MBU2476523.1 hypothetical protein [Candidatus Micrarchaeota archaeon]